MENKIVYLYKKSKNVNIRETKKKGQYALSFSNAVGKTYSLLTTGTTHNGSDFIAIQVDYRNEKMIKLMLELSLVVSTIKTEHKAESKPSVQLVNVCLDKKSKHVNVMDADGRNRYWLTFKTKEGEQKSFVANAYDDSSNEWYTFKVDECNRTAFELLYNIGYVTTWNDIQKVKQSQVTKGETTVAKQTEVIAPMTETKVQSVETNVKSQPQPEMVVMKNVGDTKPAEPVFTSKPQPKQPEVVTKIGKAHGIEYRDYTEEEIYALIGGALVCDPKDAYACGIEGWDLPISIYADESQNYSKYLPKESKITYSHREVVAMIQSALTDRYLLTPISQEEMAESKSGWLRGALDYVDEHPVKTAGIATTAIAAIGGLAYLGMRLLGGSNNE